MRVRLRSWPSTCRGYDRRTGMLEGAAAGAGGEAVVVPQFVIVMKPNRLTVSWAGSAGAAEDGSEVGGKATAGLAGARAPARRGCRRTAP